MIRGKSKIGGREGRFVPDIFNLRPLKDIDVSDFLWPFQLSSLFFFISHIPNVLRSKKITDDNLL